MSQKSGLALSSFFIFNSNFGPREGQEEKKVLFYYPYDSNVDARIKNVGLCEAIIKFSNTFAATENSCQVLRTQKTLQLFHQPEPDYWMIMCIQVPFEQRKAAASEATAGSGGGDVVTEYKGDNLHERIYRRLLQQAYRMFRLFRGTFSSHFDGGHLVDYDQMPVQLMEAFNDFYTKYLNTLRLEHCDILDVFRSIHYLPVDRILFLQIHTFVQIVQARFSAIRHCILLFDEQLVWSELNPSDMYAVYEYLTTQVFPHTVKSIARSSTPADSMHHHHYGTFVTAPAKFQNSVAIPRVHVYNHKRIMLQSADSESGTPSSAETCEIFDLVVYRSGSTSIGMFFDQTAALTDDTYHELHTFIGPQLATIGAAIADSKAVAEQQQQQQASGDTGDVSGGPAGPRYLFFNELTLRHTGTLHLNGGRPPKASAVPAEVMNLLADLYDDDELDGDMTSGRTGGCAAETVLKTLNDYWIVRRSSSWCHGFVVVNKSSTLMSVTEEARAFFDEHADNLFFDQ